MPLDYNLKLKALQNTKDLMVSKMSSSATEMKKESGKDAAEFMEEIYNGFIRLYEQAYDFESKD